MDNGLPESIGELKAWETFYEHIETESDMIRRGPRVELSPVATVELLRVREMLRKIRQKLARIEKKSKAA